MHRLLRGRTAAAALVTGSSLLAARAAAATESAEQLGGTRGEVVSNWSATHEASPEVYFEPDSPALVERILHFMHEAGRRVRVVGSALSPNGIGLSNDAMLNMAHCDAIVSVDAKAKQVTVRAGARVKEVVEALRPYGLTLQNYASIAEQQIGGFIQVGAHGTGASIPPVDEQVVAMTLITPALGAIQLSADCEPSLFRLARVGLGALGVVSEVTLQCVPAHKLVQRTFVESRAEVVKNHEKHLAHQHMRYMWIPHTDTVVVVTCDPLPAGDHKLSVPEVDEFHATAPLRELLVKRTASVSHEDARSMNFAQLRDALLALDPLSKAHVVEVNKAEALFWERSQGERIDWSDRILGFECGGQQWVSEVALPCGKVGASDGRDLAYMQDLLDMIESSDIPAPAPIEQRWTRRSSSPMSPAHSPHPNDLHTWVGIIMYLPTEEASVRDAITRRFWEYNAMCRRELWSKYDAHQHWAKIEMPDDAEERCNMKRRLHARFPMAEFNEVRRVLDPKGILTNELLDQIFSEP